LQISETQFSVATHSKSWSLQMQETERHILSRVSRLVIVTQEITVILRQQTN